MNRKSFWACLAMAVFVVAGCGRGSHTEKAPDEAGQPIAETAEPAAEAATPAAETAKAAKPATEAVKPVAETAKAATEAAKPAGTAAPGDGTYPWTVPAVTSTKKQCRVRLQLLDVRGAVISSDASDKVFTIQLAP